MLTTTALSVAPGNASDPHTSDYTFVGQVNGASGVLVSPNMVLTAKHVGSGSFTLPGIGTFPLVAGSTVNHPDDDLTLFQIDTGATVLTNFALINGENIATGTTFTMVGFGGSGPLRPDNSGYDMVLPAGIRRKAQSRVEFDILIDEPGFRVQSLAAPLRQVGDGQLAGGDSGGGWFVDYNGRPSLIGINSWIGSFGTWTDTFGFSTHPDNFAAAGAVELSRYNSWFSQNGLNPVPEPGTLAAIGLGVAALARRKRK